MAVEMKVLTSGTGLRQFWLSLLLLAAPSAQAETPISAKAEAIARREYPTETLYQLWRDPRDTLKAIEQYLASSPSRHRVESIEGDLDHLLVTHF